MPSLAMTGHSNSVAPVIVSALWAHQTVWQQAREGYMSHLILKGEKKSLLLNGKLHSDLSLWEEKDTPDLDRKGRVKKAQRTLEKEEVKYHLTSPSWVAQPPWSSRKLQGACWLRRHWWRTGLQSRLASETRGLYSHACLALSQRHKGHSLVCQDYRDCCPVYS